MIDVDKVAKLACIELDAELREKLGTQLESICAYFEQISQVDTKNVEPLVTPVDMQQVWRTDQVQSEVEIKDVLEQAPEIQGALFKVPPVVG